MFFVIDWRVDYEFLSQLHLVTQQFVLVGPLDCPKTQPTTSHFVITSKTLTSVSLDSGGFCIDYHSVLLVFQPNNSICALDNW